MLLKDLTKLPRKKERIYIKDKTARQVQRCYKTRLRNIGFNSARKQIGNISVELDTEKVEEAVRDILDYSDLQGDMFDFKRVSLYIAQHLADNIKEIVKGG